MNNQISASQVVAAFGPTRWLVSCAAAVLMLMGCSSGIQIQRVTDNAPQTGNPWNLAMTTFKVTITRQVTGCAGQFLGKVDFMATPEIVLDQDQRYVLHSDGWWATSDIASELSSDGISTGLNAQSADQSATVLANAIGTVANIAVGMAGAGDASATPVNHCTKDVANAVAALYPDKTSNQISLKTKVEQQTTEVAKATAALILTAQQVKYDKALRPKVVSALQDQENAQVHLAALEKEYADALALTSNVETVRWPERSTISHTDLPFTPSQELLGKWARSVDSADFDKQFSVHLALSDNLAGTGWVAPDLNRPVDIKVGVPVRMARAGQLLACVNGRCDGAQERKKLIDDEVAKLASLKKQGGMENSIKESEDRIKGLRLEKDPVVKPYRFNILQLGQFYIVPVTGGNFRSQQAIIKMDAGGLPTSIQVSEKVAVASALSGVAKDAANQVATLPGKMRAAELEKTTAKLNQSKAEAALASAGLVNETAAVQAQLARANAQNDLIAALSRADNQSETTSLLSQAQLWNAKADLAVAQMRSGDAMATSGLMAHTNFLNAQDALRVAMAKDTVSDQTSLLGAQTILTNAQAAQARAIAARRVAEAEAALP